MAKRSDDSNLDDKGSPDTDEDLKKLKKDLKGIGAKGNAKSAPKKNKGQQNKRSKLENRNIHYDSKSEPSADDQITDDDEVEDQDVAKKKKVKRPKSASCS